MSLNLENNIYKATNNNDNDNDNDSNNNENNNDNNINQENESSNNVNTCKNKKERSFIIPIHLLLHVILLSIFEIVLYFNYITTIENKVFYDKVKEFIKHISLTNYINDPVTAQIINYELNTDYVNEYLYEIQNEYAASIERRDDYNDQLEKGSYVITYIDSLFILYIICTINKFIHLLNFSIFFFNDLYSII